MIRPDITPIARRTIVALLAMVQGLGAQTIEEAPQLDTYFTQAGVAGTFVLLDPTEDKWIVHNAARSAQRFSPASTFKIANALIGLEAGTVKSVAEIIPYGGTKEYFKAWEQDMDLAEAMKRSNVAVFHQLAKRTGLATMRAQVKAFRYGNQDVGDSIDRRFWLTGPLKISAREQVSFVHRLTSGELAVSSANVAAVAALIVHAKDGSKTLYAKTGWSGPYDPQIGWWVGWVADGKEHHPFALNIDIKDDADAAKRLIIGKQCLNALGIFPST